MRMAKKWYYKILARFELKDDKKRSTIISWNNRFFLPNDIGPTIFNSRHGVKLSVTWYTVGVLVWCILSVYVRRIHYYHYMYERIYAIRHIYKFISQSVFPLLLQVCKTHFVKELIGLYRKWVYFGLRSSESGNNIFTPRNTVGVIKYHGLGWYQPDLFYLICMTDGCVFHVAIQLNKTLIIGLSEDQANFHLSERLPHIGMHIHKPICPSY